MSYGGFEAVGGRGMGADGFIVYDDTTCMVVVEERQLVSSILAAFGSELDEHLERGRCPRPRRLPIPKLLGLTDGRATYDERSWHEHPDLRPLTTPGRIDRAG